ncbi:MFS transporter [Micromonospora sp. NPDC050200]|uniref:MFS transporter n=1 Tax=Micromonospora sp. NPDC050200 TaxID=3155664 RepID=UPI0033C8BE5D
MPRFDSLRQPNFRNFLAGQFVSYLGTWMQFIAQDWLVLHLSGNSGSALGLVTALQFAPVLLLGLYGGKLADQHDKRIVLAAAGIMWTVLAAGIAALVLTGEVRLWHVFVFAAALGSVSAIEKPARQAFVSELVGSDLVPNALALNSIAFNSARIIGPALSGGLIAWLDTGPVFALNAFSYLAPVVGIALIRPADLRRPAARPRKASITAGLTYVRRRPDLLLPLGVVFIVALVGFNFPITLALLAKVVFDAGAASFGLLSSALAVGAMAGAYAGAGRRGRPSAYRVLGAAAAFGATEALVALAPTYWAAAALLVPTGFSMIFFAQAANQRVQLGVGPAYQGRVMALYLLVFAGTNPVGAPIVGWLAEHAGTRSSLYIGGLVSIVTAAAAYAIVRGRPITDYRPRPT